MSVAEAGRATANIINPATEKYTRRDMTSPCYLILATIIEGDLGNCDAFINSNWNLCLCAFYAKLGGCSRQVGIGVEGSIRGSVSKANAARLFGASRQDGSSKG